MEEALDAAHELGYPVLLRPSYVIGGQNMVIAHNDEDVRTYMEVILSGKHRKPGAGGQVPAWARSWRWTSSPTARTS